MRVGHETQGTGKGESFRLEDGSGLDIKSWVSIYCPNCLFIYWFTV